MTFFALWARGGAWFVLSLGALVACGGSTGDSGGGSTGGASSGGSGTVGNVPVGSCVVRETVYPDGSSFPIDCNDCWCDFGSIACTQKACGGSTCEWNGEVYADGEGVPGDCAGCRCENGFVNCPLILCDPGCGGPEDLGCSSGEFCRYDLEEACGAEEKLGTCEVLPTSCDLVYAPVCGCDGNTYGNECAAHAEGVNVASEGECP